MRLTKSNLAIIAGLVLASAVHAQNPKEFPFKPLPTIRVQLTCPKTDTLCQETHGVKPGEKWWEPLPVRRKTADAAYLGLTAANLGVSVLDFENSIHAIGDCSKAHEANPLYGKCPGRARYYGIGGAIAGASAYISWRWKREDSALRDAGYPPHTGWSNWKIPQIVNLASHIVGIAVTLGSTGR